MSSDQQDDSNTKKPEGQDLNRMITDLVQSEESIRRDGEATCSVQPIIEHLEFRRHCESHYAEQKDCAVNRINSPRNDAVDSLIRRAESGKLTIEEIKKLKIAVEQDGLHLSPEGRAAFEQYAASHGHTLQECLQFLLEINGFIRVTGEAEFDPDDNHAGMIDLCARIPMFIPEALANRDATLTFEKKMVLVNIIVLQANEMKAQAKGLGKWPKETAFSVAKAWITRYSLLLQESEQVFAKERADIRSRLASTLNWAHEEASGLLKHVLCASYVEKAQVDAICGWLRATKEWFPPQLPWDAPKNVHEGLEFLADRFGMAGQPPAAAPAEISTTTANPPEQLTGNEEQRCAPESAEEPAAQKTRVAVGKLVILELNKCLKYDGEHFTIHGDERWNDIRALMDANGEYVELEEGFPQRFAHGDAKRFRMVATEAEGPGRKGTGRYKIKQ